MSQEIGDILIPPDEIAARVRGLGDQLARAYAGRVPVLVAIMKGCVLFLADLVRAWPTAMDIEFVTARSYEGQTPGRVEVTLPPELAEKVAGRPVLVVDDIFDTGQTLTEVCREVERLGPEEVRALVLLRKRRSPLPAGVRQPDWVGFDVDDRFVIGYGLDYDGRFRNLPYIAVLTRRD